SPGLKSGLTPGRRSCVPPIVPFRFRLRIYAGLKDEHLLMAKQSGTCRPLGVTYFLVLFVFLALSLSARPIVAIHDSELTRALESMSATNAGTPVGSNTTGFEWWPTNWHYFVMPESLKEALRADGTTFEVVSDADITAGHLMSNGVPVYPIVISLASEAV